MNFEPKFAMPKGCPESLVERLMKIACDTATVFGAESSRDGVIITDEAISYLVGAMGAGLIVAAHDTLHRSATLLADPKIQAWLHNNPVTPE